MGCGGSKEEAKSPRSADHDDDPHDSPPASPSMQDIEGLDGDSTTKKLGSSDPRHDPELRRFPDRDASSIRAGASGKSRLHKGGTMVLVTSYRLTSENEMSKLESKCPEFAASWEYRKRRVVKEVIDIQPDVLCLQGVSDFAWFESELLKHGMSGVFEAVKAAPEGEGCAIFVRNEILKIDKTFSIKGVGAAALVMEQDAPEQDPGTIVVSAWFSHGMDGTNMLDCIDIALKDEGFKRHSMIIAGEMGEPSTPFIDSVMDTENNVYSITDLKSAYQDPPYTLCSSSKLAVTDYIFYKSDFFELIGTMAMIDAGTLQADDHLPNADWPSFHVSLHAMFEFKVRTVLKSSPYKSDEIVDEDCPDITTPE